MTEKRVIDWESIEREYIPAIRSLRDIANQFGIAESAIRDRAKRYGWERNLEEKIKAKKESLLRKDELRKSTAQTSKITEKEIIESAATIQATVILEEREDVKRLAKICESLEKQLELIADDKESAEDLEKKARINKTLIESRDKVFNMRRRNYGINDNANGDADKKNGVSSAMTIDDIQRERDAINARRTVR